MLGLLLLCLGAGASTLDAEDPRIRAQAYRSLGDAGDPASLDVLAKRLATESDPAARVAGQNAMGRLQLTEDQLHHALAHSEAPIARAWAAHSLGRYPGAATVAALEQSANDPEPKVRREVYESLGGLGDISARDVLMVAANRDPSLALRAVAEKATLALIAHDTRTLDVPTQLALLQSGAPEQRTSAAQTLGKAGDWRAVQPLIHATSTGSEPLRIAAISALGELGDLRAVPALTQIASDRMGAERYHAIGALAKLKDESSLDTLEDLTEDVDANTRQFAVRAIFWINGPDTIRRVEALIRDPEEKVRAELLLGLSELTAEARNPLLLLALDDNSPFLRAEAVRLLGSQAGGDVQEPLLKALDDKDPLVRVVAAESLAARGDRNAVPRLETLVARTRAEEEKAAYQKALDQLR